MNSQWVNDGDDPFRSPERAVLINPICDYAVTRTEYEGNPAPEANSLLAFFDVGPGLQIELIQPMVGQSLCFHKPYVKNLVKI